MPSESVKKPSVATFHPKRTVHAVAVQVGLDDPTLEFAAESEPETAKPSRVRRWIALVAAAVLLLVAALGLWLFRWTAGPATPTGTVRVDSDPSGAQVTIDGQVRGVTPVVLSLPSGRHSLQVQEAERVQDLPIEVARGGTSAYHVTWAAPSPTTSGSTGDLSVTSDAPGSAVTVDGVDRGRTPLTLTGLTTGAHDVVVRSGTSVSRHAVQIEAGSTAALLVTGAPAQAPWGWISLSTPFRIRVLEAGKVIGTSEVDRILLSPGDHELDLVAEPFGFRQTSRVKVVPGRAAQLPLTIPQVPLSINALPWADVSIDGVSIGETPLADVLQPIGDHEIVFRHPQLGEKRLTARVMTQGTPRITTDMRDR